MRITICGKVVYRKNMLDMERILTYSGYTVFTPILSSLIHPLTEIEIKELHRAHEEKIDLADEVWFITPYGEDTAREYEYAKSKGKLIRKISISSVRDAIDKYALSGKESFTNELEVE